MTAMRRALGSGLVTMCLVASASAIWPTVAAAVSAVFLLVLVIAGSVPALLGARWAKRELAWRRELAPLPSVGGVVTAATTPSAPALAELRESA